MREVKPDMVQYIMELLMEYADSSSEGVKTEYARKFEEMTSTLDDYGKSITSNSEHISEINKDIQSINKMLYAGVACTQAEYNALTDAEKNNGKIYFIVEK